jgi:hypothetical protein
MVLKDSSKYVKKKPVSKMQATSIPGTPTGSAPGIDLLKPPTPQATQNQMPPLNNLMQSMQEGLSQILNPAQTFYHNNGGLAGNNTSSSGNSAAQDPHKQTPTFTQHMSKIIIKELDS